MSPRLQATALGVIAITLAFGGFQAGRQSVDAAAIGTSLRANSEAPSASISPSYKPLPPPEQTQIIVRDIATVPFSELYDILKAASREQLLAWAADLEQMPRGPRQRAAVGAYFKSLVQVDHRAAIEAVLNLKNLLARDAAIDGMMKAAPESIWGDLAEMTARMPYSGRGWGNEDVILNWSRVDPVAASKFIERHPFSAEQKQPDGEDARISSLLSNWGEIDPSAARTWLEADPSRQTEGAFRALLTSWGHVSSAGAIEYGVANAHEPKFAKAINELVYQFVRSTKEDATRLILLLRTDQAQAALKNVAEITNPEVIDPNLDRPPDYQRPPDEVARWMVSLPVELWSESIGLVAQAWMNKDARSATNWINQLSPEMREAAVVSLCDARQSAPREDVIMLAWTIRDSTLRERALGALARSLRMEREDAIEAVDELPISDEQKAYLLKLMPEDSNAR